MRMTAAKGTMPRASLVPDMQRTTTIVSTRDTRSEIVKSTASHRTGIFVSAGETRRATVFVSTRDTHRTIGKDATHHETMVFVSPVDTCRTNKEGVIRLRLSRIRGAASTSGKAQPGFTKIEGQKLTC
eukprot:341941-Rhodomonas_salina.2